MLIGKNELGGECSDVDDSGQLLDSVEEDVAVLDDRLVLRVLRVGAVGDDDAADLSRKVEEISTSGNVKIKAKGERSDE